MELTGAVFFILLCLIKILEGNKMEGEPLTILLVEDNSAHAELVMRNFEDHLVANKIVWVEDGAAALDYLFGRGQYADTDKYPLPQLILLDLRLPKIDGIEVLKQAKAEEKLRNIPIVVLTTSQAETDIAKAYSNHANSYLVKPVDFNNFTKLMKDLGFYWLCWNHK